MLEVARWLAKPRASSRGPALLLYEGSPGGTATVRNARDRYSSDKDSVGAPLSRQPLAALQRRATRLADGVPSLRN
jgi:hypothetical protein